MASKFGSSLVRFLDIVDEVVIGAKRNKDSIDLQLLEYFIDRLRLVDNSTEKILLSHSCGDTTCHSTQIKIQLRTLQQNVRQLRDDLRRKKTEILQSNEGSSAFKAGVEKTGGRPRFIVTQGQLERLISLSFSWNQIAAIFGISRTTLWRRKKELAIVDKYTEISDNDLDGLVRNYRDKHPYTGEREMIGCLRGSGCNIQRYRVRESINRIDPINTALRWHDPIKRRPYSVASPNSLWHIDSNLKLIRWGFALQGGVDGFSRVIVYMKCNLNNRSSTTLNLFKEAERLHGKPSRARSDYGTENFGVGQYMLESRGLNRGSIITGPSTHNTRIERMWKECGKSVIHLYSRVFTHLEMKALCLDLGNPVHVFCLQYIFLPRINLALSEWVSAWNSHPMSNCRNNSPLQIREQGFLARYGSSDKVVRDVFDKHMSCSMEEFGIDWDDTMDCGEHENSSVPNFEVPRAQLSIPSEDALVCLSDVDPLSLDNNYGIDLYNKCVKILQEYLDK